MGFVSYIRVSTQKQGRSGLGLEAQRKMCADFVASRGGEIVREFMDVESGTHRDRKGLWGAIDYCKANKLPLVIAKLDRLARDVEFTFKVINTGIEIHFTDMPTVNTMILGVFAAVAQYERELTSDRTKKALAVKKEQGVKLGAANDKYNLNEEELSARGTKAGATRTRRMLEHRDTQVIIKIMKQVFPECNEHPESEWKTSYITLRKDKRIEFLTAMANYKDVDKDGLLFAKWDLTDINNPKIIAKLTSKLQNIINILTRK